MVVWKPITGYSGLYEISNVGTVRTCPREVKTRWGNTYVRKRKILGRVLDKNGKYRVSLRKDGKNRKFYIHRLVAEHFHDIPKRYKRVGDKVVKRRVKHINGVLTDNRHCNLIYI